MVNSAQIVPNDGFVISGVRGVAPAASTTKPDFVIDKTDGSFAINGGSDFTSDYFLWRSSNCFPPLSRIHNCYGTYVVPTSNMGNGEAYAVAGTFSDGVFFATLSSNGTIIRKIWWNFSITNHPNRPFLRESVANPGFFYICGHDGWLSSTLGS